MTFDYYSSILYPILPFFLRVINDKIIDLVKENLPEITFSNLSNIVKNDNKEKINQILLDK